MVQFLDFSFAYPKAQKPAVKGLSLTVQQGEFVVLFGDSGSGKTTLLRNLVPAIAPFGSKAGEIRIGGKELCAFSQREMAQTVGFLSQRADNQIVTDKVWHELAFGLENLGFSTLEIRTRVAEIAAYFGITDWYDRDVHSLSGGQKQILCLAAVMVTSPKVLVLDEPLSQLDPVSITRYLDMLHKINSEKGVTIVMAEHQLEPLFGTNCKFVYLQDGQVCHDEAAYFESLPTLTKLSQKLDIEKGGVAQFKGAFTSKYTLAPFVEEEKKEGCFLQVRSLYFRYEREGNMVLSDINLSFSHRVTGLIGANGSGKSTLLTCLAGRKIKEGKIVTDKSVAMLPQDVQILFTEKTVREDLQSAVMGQTELFSTVVALFDLDPFLESHPYDLSGGEQQLVGVAKLLLSGADILLLDEPTKGMSPSFQKKVALAIATFVDKKFIIASHDLEFCTQVTDFLVMLFQGQVIGQNTPRALLGHNKFYTTPIGRVLEQEAFGNLLYEDVLAQCKKRD